MRKPLNLRCRLALEQTASFSLLLILLACAAYFIGERSILRDLDDKVSDRAASVRSMMLVRDDSVTWLNEQADPEVKNQFAQSLYQVLNSSGNIVDGSGATFNVPITANAKSTLMSHTSTWDTIRLNDGHRIRILNTFVAGTKRNQSYVLRVGIAEEEPDDYRRQYLLVLILGIPLIIAIQAATARRVTNMALQPLTLMSKVAAEINSTNLSRRFAVAGTGDEFDQLTASLNGMIARLEAPFREIAEVLPNLAHELRRPLTILRGDLEIAQRREMAELDYRVVLSCALDQIDRLAGTVADMTAMPWAESQDSYLHRDDQEVSELLRAAVDGMSTRASAHGVELTADIAEGISGEINPGQIYRSLQNLIDNSIKYNRPHGEVHVSADRQGDFIVLVVTDTGIGISATDLPHIFDRFYRSPTAKKLNVPGCGVGLAFVKMVIEAHGGRLDVDSVEGQGTTFRVWLPGTNLVEQSDPSGIDGIAEMV